MLENMLFDFLTGRGRDAWRTVLIDGSNKTEGKIIAPKVVDQMIQGNQPSTMRVLLGNLATQNTTNI